MTGRRAKSENRSLSHDSYYVGGCHLHYKKAVKFRVATVIHWPQTRKVLVLEFFWNYSSALEMSSANDCVRCKETVRQMQQALQCECCERWQHRTCGTGVSQQHYREAVRGDRNIEWRCEDCLNMSAGFLLPVAESTRTDGEFHFFSTRVLSSWTM